MLSVRNRLLCRVVGQVLARNFRVARDPPRIVGKRSWNCRLRQSSVNSQRRGSPVSVYRRLFQLRVLRLGFLQDGDVGVGVSPESKEILIRRLGFGGVARHGISST